MKLKFTAFTITRDIFEGSGGGCEDWHCVDCNMDTAPGMPTDTYCARVFAAFGDVAIPAVVDSTSEVYSVHARIWKAVKMKGWGGCLCVGCLETRLGRKLTPKDFTDHPFNSMPGTRRLLLRRGRK